MANFLIFAGLFTRYLFNMRKKHPSVPTRVSVDYAIVLAALPSTILGSYFGVILNVVFSKGVNLILICLIFIGAVI